jgi:hypothetical protein
MTQTIEDVLEILGGRVPRTVNIHIDIDERNLIQSLSKQVHRGIPLTDRQLSLSLKKIEKYRDGLEKNNVDVDNVLNIKLLRMPLREIDRLQSVYLEEKYDGHRPRIVVKYVFSKKFAAEWSMLEENLIGVQSEVKGFKHILYNEKNIFFLVSTLSALEFVIDQKIQEIYENIVKIMENPEKIIPYVNCQQGQIKVENISTTCEKYLNEKFPLISENNFLDFLATTKNCGISLKSPEIVKKIHNFAASDLSKNILLEKSTKFRVNPSTHTLENLFTVVDELNQWPVLVVVDENSQVFGLVRSTISTLTSKVDLDKINVFFRLKNEQPENQQFNQFVRDNGLNNYIDEKTKAVFITKNRIPKPLFKANWSPKSALVFSSNDFGKLSAYLNDIPNVYYYNDSLTLRHSRVKGSKEIAQL